MPAAKGHIPMRSLAVLLLAASATGVQAQESVAEFYRGKTLNIVVGHEPGTGYDFFGRTFARHIGRHLPGNPNAVAQNMQGAGGTRAAGWLYNVAAKDGTVVSIFAPETALKSLFEDQPPNYDSAKFNWIGNMDQSVATCAVSGKSGIRSLDELKTREVVFGATGVAAPTSKFTYALINFVGAKIKVAQGYKGSAAQKLAMVRGEVDGGCGASHSTLKTQWRSEIDSGQVRPLVQFGLTRLDDPDLKGAAHIYDYATTPEMRELFDVAFGPHILGRPLIAPPGVPAERVRALRAAFTTTMKDREFLAEVAKAGLEISPFSGEEVDKLVARFASVPKSVVARAHAGMTERK
jgi:tripartite-type tricarboxylate transporter receptor subunit TctC